MKLLKGVALGLGALLVLVVAISFFLPTTFHVDRTVSIHASAAQVHRLTSDLEHGWPQWEPFSRADPTIVTTLGEITSGVGAHQSWTGKDGTGELTFTLCDESTGVGYDMAFDGDKYLSKGTLLYTVTADGTDVTWAMDGDAEGVIGKYFALMMDPMVGPMFEQGLQNLKDAAESSD